MVLLQPKLNLKVSQRQILTPGLVQMVSLLALNKIEVKEMIDAEMVENPVLEELDDSVPSLDEIAANEEQREREAQRNESETEGTTPEERDPFGEIDFGSYFSEYLDPGFRSRVELETIEKPSFENFLSKPTTLTDHLLWQLGAMNVPGDVRSAAELVIGNLSEDGYLLASDDELISLSCGLTQAEPDDERESGIAPANAVDEISDLAAAGEETATPGGPQLVPSPSQQGRAAFSRDALHEAIDLVSHMDPVGVAARDLRGCLLPQLDDLQEKYQENGGDPSLPSLLADCRIVVERHLPLLQNKQHKDISRLMSVPVARVDECIAFIRRLDPRPGLRYNLAETRLIEPDVAIIKQGDEYMALMNDDDLPQLRLSPAYKGLLTRDTEKDVRTYVKERYKSAMQLIKNIEQRKQTILRVCQAIIQRQKDFLDHGIDQLKPMMIKDVAEQIGVHPSTVSRAVANKYAHTPQGVFELRYFFSEGVQGPEGGGTSLLILKRRVKKMIEDEDPARPLTDEQITHNLHAQGINVTRRTVAKYREDMKIPSTHQRRVRR